MPTLIEKLRALTTPASRKVADPLQAIGSQLAGVEAALQQAEIERASAARELTAADARRDALLVSGSPYSEVRAHDDRLDEIRDTLRALELFTSQQQRRRTELVAQRTTLIGARLRAKWHDAATSFAKTLLATHREYEALTAIVSEINAAGVPAADQAGWLVQPPWIYRDAELFTRWQSEVERVAPGYIPPPPAPVASAPPQVPMVAAPAPAPVAPARAPRTAPVLPPSDGQVRVIAMRRLTYGDTAYAGGDVFDMSEEAADAAMRSGSVDLMNGAAS